MTHPPQIDVAYLAKAYASALPATIEQYVMDCRIAKSDAEHWACQEITTLRAQKQALVDRVTELENWQPMATARKDGTHILIYGLNSNDYPEFYVGFYESGRGEWQPVVYEAFIYEAQYWMPLPAKPSPERTPKPCA